MFSIRSTTQLLYRLVVTSLVARLNLSLARNAELLTNIPDIGVCLHWHTSDLNESYYSTRKFFPQNPITLQMRALVSQAVEEEKLWLDIDYESSLEK